MRLLCTQSGVVLLALLGCTLAIEFPSVNRGSRLADISLPNVRLPAVENVASKIQLTAKKIAEIPNLREIASGPAEKQLRPELKVQFEKSIPTALVTEVGKVANRVSNDIKQALLKDNKVPRTSRGSIPFGPHLLVNPAAQEIARAGAVFQEATLTAVKGLKLGRSSVSKLKGLNVFRNKIPTCPFRKEPICNKLAEYRTIDGSCNNLKNPLWGRANTPFNRFLPPQYQDGFSSPRSESVFSGPLPLARIISTEIHKKSVVADLHPDITHMAMEFGQIVSHDVNRNTLSAGYNGGSLSCCTAAGGIDNSRFKATLGCLPIEIPANDPFFSQHGRTCMNFVRASPTPGIDCDLGFRQQLNQVTHFIDASTVYGSDQATMTQIRTMSDGKLKVTNSINGDLLPQNPSSGGCVTTGTQHCFKAGDVRSNQQPGLMSLHTIFLREHNRIAGVLKTVNPGWNDEKLFQEARKIVGAEVQHVTYTEYLPSVLGSTFAGAFGFQALPAGTYFTGYTEAFNPAINNAFAAAAYRFGHSTVRDHVAPGQLFKDHFLKPALLYQSSKGPTHLAQSLIEDRQQKTDNLMTDQLTNHLFERAAGTGMDLAATNIQRGRDHGVANYNLWRLWCRLDYVDSFNNMVDHTPAVAALLQGVYQHPDDIDLWTGIVTETPLDGKALGPTGACIVGRQFWILKHADRFYYENNNANVKFVIEQLNEIRKTSLAKIICDNTDLSSLQADVFEKVSPSNPKVSCSTLSGIDLSQWREPCVDRQWGRWTPYSPCVSGIQTRRRRCEPPVPGVCSNPCRGPASGILRCNGGSGFPFPLRPRFAGLKPNLRPFQ